MLKKVKDAYFRICKLSKVHPEDAPVETVQSLRAERDHLLDLFSGPRVCGSTRAIIEFEYSERIRLLREAQGG
jgi:hypothetical protein